MTFSPCGARKERTPVDVFINTSKHISPNDKVHSWDLRHRNRFPWLSTYAIEVWASAHYCKYLSQIDKFCKRALHYTSKYTPIMDVIRMKDRLLWEEITSDSANPLHELLPAQRARSLRKRGHNYILPPVRTERFKRCFFNRCLFEFV
mgnify:CR=1 FL=1